MWALEDILRQGVDVDDADIDFMLRTSSSNGQRIQQVVIIDFAKSSDQSGNKQWAELGPAMTLAQYHNGVYPDDRSVDEEEEEQIRLILERDRVRGISW
jgi:hypothetical protein